MFLKSKFLIIIFIALTYSVNALCMYEKMIDNWNVIQSAAIFHISMFYNKWMYGADFTFNVIINETGNNNSIGEKNIILEQDVNGAIIKLNDGENTPIVLGTIPYNHRHMTILRKQFKLLSEDNIDLYVLTRQFECNWAGLSWLIKNDKKINVLHYPTTDFTAPSFIDLLRAVRDLKNRDAIVGQKLAYVHCKAGRGRSAVVVAAYILYLFNRVNVDVSIDQIEFFLQTRRPQVKFNNVHKTALTNFQNSLKKAGNFEQLYELHKDKVEQRDKIIYLYM